MKLNLKNFNGDITINLSDSEFSEGKHYVVKCKSNSHLDLALKHIEKLKSKNLSPKEQFEVYTSILNLEVQGIEENYEVLNVIKFHKTNNELLELLASRLCLISTLDTDKREEYYKGFLNSMGIRT